MHGTSRKSLACPSNFWVHAQGVVRRHTLLRSVLRRFWEGFWGRALRRGLAMVSLLKFKRDVRTYNLLQMSPGDVSHLGNNGMQKAWQVPEGLERHLDAARRFCRSVVSQLPSPGGGGQFWKKKKTLSCGGEANLGGIFKRQFGGEGNCESKMVARQLGSQFCREASRCLAGPSGFAFSLQTTRDCDAAMLATSTPTPKFFMFFTWRPKKGRTPPPTSRCQGSVKGVYLKVLFAQSRLFYREMDCPVRWSLATPSALESQSRANQGSVVANPICKCRRHKAGHLQVRVAVGRQSTCVLKEAPLKKGHLGLPQDGATLSAHTP